MESRSDNGNSIKISLVYESELSKNGYLKHSKIEIGILSSGGNADKEESCEFRGASPETPISDSPSIQNENSRPATRSWRRRNYTKPKQYGFIVSEMDFEITTSDTPSIHEAMNSTTKEIELWQAAIESKFKSLFSESTESPVIYSIGPTHRPLPAHAILKFKRNQERNVSRLKARVAAGSSLQREDMDFGAVYAPVVDSTDTFLTTLFCLSNSWSVHHVDVKAAFLNGDIDRDVFVYHS